MSRWLCKDYLQGTCNLILWKVAPSRMLLLQDEEWLSVWRKVLIRTSSGWWTADEKVLTKVQWLCWRKEIGKKENLSPMNVPIDRGNLGREVIRNWDKIRLNVNLLMLDNWIAYFRTWRRRSLFSGRAPTCRDQSNVWSSQRLLHVIPKFETKIRRSDIFAQVNLMSVAPTLQNLRIGFKRRQSGKSKVPAKQRGSWPKEFYNWVAWKSNILLTFGK